MIQFYFLSIFCNAAAGYTLICRKEPDTRTQGNTIKGAFFPWEHDTLRLILGIVSIITGLFKLLSAVQGDVPVVGDLIPALSGFASGSMLVLAYYRTHTSLPETGSPGITDLERILVTHKRQIGFLALGTAALHFLFPQALLI
ncbi:MAG: hypothetical protein LBP88_06655 [Treponema sp.]|jgi:hypothetical protein|nr:hypothetical protein [Treponema sp.]